MSKGLFITGTDTGVGKTYVSTLLIRRMVDAGNRVAGMKPLATGAVIKNGDLMNDDAMRLVGAANVECNYESVNPYCFAPPIAPHIAAQEAATEIKPDFIRQAYRQLSEQADVVIVEGIGGWSVPINETQTMAEVVKLLGLPVLLVVGMKLGCLNHSLLTAQAIEHSGNHLAGWIANVLDPDMGMLQENIASLQQRLHAPLLGVVQFEDPHSNLDMSLLIKLLRLK